MFANSRVSFPRIYNELGTLQTAEEMFYLCTANHWYGHLPNLTNGYAMFRGCFDLENFASGTHKGNGTELNAEAIDMDSLTNGSCMFEYCNSLEYFCAHCDSLKIAYSMFKDCQNLKKANFASGLPSIQNADGMFQGCSKLIFTSDHSNYHEMHQADFMFSNSYKVGTSN